VPVKPLRVAKSRLRGLPGWLRQELVVAMAADTVAAAVSCPGVVAVYVVTDDHRAAEAVLSCGAVVVADEPDAGLNPALEHGGAVASLARPDCGVAALSADLPALTGVELAAALTAAGAHRRAFVADARRTGTTLLAAASGVLLAPAYGENSRRRHVASGAVELALDGCDGLRADVDTVEDLAAVRRLRIGSRTRAVLARLADEQIGAG